MWFGYANENAWIPVEASRVFEILELNKKGKRPASLVEDEEKTVTVSIQTLNKDLEKMNQKYSKRKKKQPTEKNKYRKYTKKK